MLLRNCKSHMQNSSFLRCHVVRFCRTGTRRSFRILTTASIACTTRTSKTQIFVQLLHSDNKTSCFLLLISRIGVVGRRCGCRSEQAKSTDTILLHLFLILVILLNILAMVTNMIIGAIMSNKKDLLTVLLFGNLRDHRLLCHDPSHMESCILLEYLPLRKNQCNAGVMWIHKASTSVWPIVVCICRQLYDTEYQRQ